MLGVGAQPLLVAFAVSQQAEPPPVVQLGPVAPSKAAL
jgi:hypothetical protein